jgi:hypothetical protein
MTTFEQSSVWSLRKAVAALVTMGLLYASAVPAASPKSSFDANADTPSPTCLQTFNGHVNDIEPASKNRYLLLLFFNNKDETIDRVYKLIHGVRKTKDHDASPGCIPDPDDQTHARGLMVHPGCPKDCLLNELKRIKGRPDPLGDLHGPVWGIFFADPSPAGDAQTDFRVWQIAAHDANHAYNILKWLRSNPDDPNLFTADGGYRGEIMIGYTYPPKRDCTAEKKCGKGHATGS